MREQRLRDPATESATENKPPRFSGTGARVKRWSKSPPPREQSRGHGKPRRVQGQIGNGGAARSWRMKVRPVSGTAA